VLTVPPCRLLQPWQGNYSVRNKTGQSVLLMSRIVPIKGMTGYVCTQMIRLLSDSYDDINRMIKNLFTRSNLLIILAIYILVKVQSFLHFDFVVMFMCLLVNGILFSAHTISFLRLSQLPKYILV